MDREQLAAWLSGYERLWRTSGTEGLAEIFSQDAVYSMGPYEEPVRGLDALAELWEGERRSADEEFELKTEIVAVDGDTGVAQVEVEYGPPHEQEYREIWVIRFGADGRCVRFEEWPYWPDQSSVAPARD
ncbi:MAG: nuclear transport factor 2 family protein [Actinomycetota bacterium]|nr:nuclear transport factor 2 family protein [Actinomycetota bacterium]